MLKMLLACMAISWACYAQDEMQPPSDPQSEIMAGEQATPPRPAGYPFTPVADALVLGTGPETMILIPDIRFTGEALRTFMERNSDRYTMHAITPPGYGGTAMPPPKPEGEFGAWEMNAAAGIAHYIREKGLQQPIVLGHGMGGRLATIVAAEHEGLVGKVIALNTQFSWPLPKNENPTPEERVEFIKKEMLPRMAKIPEAEWLRRKKLNMPQMTIDTKRSEQIAELAMRTGRVAEDGYVVDFAARDLRPLLPSIRVPVLLFEANGLNDAPKVFRDRQEEVSRANAAHIPGAKVVVFRQTRHFAFDDRPEEFDAAIVAFLKGEQPVDLDPPPVKYNNVPTVDAPPPTGFIRQEAPAPTTEPAPQPGDPAPAPGGPTAPKDAPK